MNKIFGVLLFSAAFLSTTYAVGQVYEGLDQALIEPLDRVVEEHNAVYANAANVAEAEEAMSQEERYTNMTEPFDTTIDQHFNVVTGQ